MKSGSRERNPWIWKKMLGLSNNECRKLFPPTQQDLPASPPQAPPSLISDPPDPPTTTEPLESGRPGREQQGPSTSLDDDWERVEPPPTSKRDFDVDSLEEERSASDIENGVMSREETEQVTAALHTAQMGGGVQRSSFSKEW